MKTDSHNSLSAIALLAKEDQLPLSLPALPVRGPVVSSPVVPLVRPFKFAAQPYEYKVVPLRECPTPESLQLCDTPQKAADYWRLHVTANPYFNPECECRCCF